MKSLNEFFFVESVATHDILASSTLVMAEGQTRTEQRESMKAIEDLRREVKSDICALTESIKLTSDSCDRIK